MAGLSKAKIQLARPGSAKEPQARTVSNRVHMSVVFKGTVLRDGYFFEDLNILMSTFWYALMIFKVFQKL